LILALRTGEPYRVARALAIETAYLGRGGTRTWHETARLIERTRVVAETSGNPHAIGCATMYAGLAHHLSGQFRKALVLFEQAIELLLTRCTNVAWEIDTMQLFVMNDLAQLGELRRFTREAPHLLRDALERGDIYAAVNLRTGLVNMQWLVADDPEEARSQINAAMRQWSKDGFHVEHFYELIARTNVDLYEGRGREAYARVKERWPALTRSLMPATIQYMRLYTLHFRARAALAAAATDEANRAELLAVAARDARRIEREKTGWGTPQAKLVVAAVALARGDSARATATLRAAIDGFDAAGMALYAEAARLCLSALVGGDEAQSLAKGARAWMEAAGVKDPRRMTAMLAPGLPTPP
jgi:hypothetical protein